jgi:two-component system response regulator RegA
MNSLAEIDVLVVEDSVAVSATIAHALQQKGLTTDVAGDVTEAKRLLSRMRYKAMILDLVLPDGRGGDVLEFIRTAELPRLPVIVITGSFSDGSVFANLDRSMVKSILFKPNDPQDVADFVYRLTRPTSTNPI